ncbi:unnamed protein product [Euphydryas editha]|uniref:PiggyBac transposable element-derived protein domain-containing protein n=1 Tax=Euphydryas editha TaxID=104508 RepID=A0AAU9URZ8_EUPED|nr:unnamed protein product [Euphydryas editha]
MDSIMESRIIQWLHEEFEDEEVIQSESDGGEGEVQPMEQEDRHQVQEAVSEDQSSSSEDDMSLSELAQNKTRDDIYVSRNGTRWSKTCPSATRARSQNIRFRPPGPKGAARNAETPLSCFELFFDESIFEILVICTNIYIDKIQNQYQRERDAKRTDLFEMKALMGLLLGIGVSHSGRRNLNDFWDNSKGTGLQLVYCTMSINRFRFLIRVLPFDDVNDRDERRRFDKLAPIRTITQKMVKNCRDNFTPSDYLTLDEQLVGFRGRCGFIVYIPNKPDKLGIKIYMVVDTKFPYVYNFEVYAGAQSEGPFQQSNKVNDVVLRILEPLFDLGCNVTMDNYLTMKPFMVVACDGYVIDIVGPYAETQSNADIMKSLFQDEHGTFCRLFRQNDMFILDGGFRDATPFLEDLNYSVFKPESLDEGQHQLTFSQANKSRKVTVQMGSRNSHWRI